MENSKINVSNIMNAAKVLAILTVIIAHSRNTDYYLISIITERLGAIGVPVFLFISGYYFNVKSKGGLKNFWRKKIFTIFIPWVFTGSILFFVSRLKFRFSDFHILDLLNWILGNGTYLWYLTVLILCYLFFSYVERKLYLIVLIVINIISLVLTSFGLIDFLAKETFGITVNHYLNVFNWVGYFSLGVLAKGKLESYLSFLKTKVIFILPLYAVSLVISFFIEPNAGGYFSKLAMPMQFAGLICIFAVSSLSLFNKPVLYMLSEISFTIYLTHFLVFPIRAFLIQSPLFEFVNPIIILTINAGLLLFMWKVAKLIKLNKLYTTLVGIREPKNIEKRDYTKQQILETTTHTH